MRMANCSAGTNRRNPRKGIYRIGIPILMSLPFTERVEMTELEIARWINGALDEEFGVEDRGEVVVRYSRHSGAVVEAVQR